MIYKYVPDNLPARDRDTMIREAMESGKNVMTNWEPSATIRAEFKVRKLPYRGRWRILKK